LAALVTAALVLAPQPWYFVGAELAARYLSGLRVPILFTYQHVMRTSAGFPITTIIMIGTRQLFGAAGGAALLLDAR
jgi:hypothetical protein